MSIRLRTVGNVRVALCAAETDEQPGDVYLDDADHYALAAKFCRDWQGQTCDWTYPDEWSAMDTQKLRDAEEEIAKATIPEKGELLHMLENCTTQQVAAYYGVTPWKLNKWLKQLGVTNPNKPGRKVAYSKRLPSPTSDKS